MENDSPLATTFARKLRIVCRDGTPMSLTIVDAETSEDLRLPFAEVTWRIRANNFAEVTLVIDGVQLDVEGIATDLHITDGSESLSGHEDQAITSLRAGLRRLARRALINHNPLLSDDYRAALEKLVEN